MSELESRIKRPREMIDTWKGFHAQRCAQLIGDPGMGPVIKEFLQNLLGFLEWSGQDHYIQFFTGDTERPTTILDIAAIKGRDTLIRELRLTFFPDAAITRPPTTEPPDDEKERTNA